MYRSISRIYPKFNDCNGSKPSVRRFKQQTFDCQLTVVPLPARLNYYCTDETGP